jgi:hypothetical protein
VARGVRRHLVLAAAALVGASLLALIASGAFAVGNELQTGSAAAHGLSARVAARLTGAHAQSELAEALQLLQARGGTVAAQLGRHARAQQLLASLAAKGNGRAANLLGVLSAEQALTDRRHARDLTAAARASFVAAIRADPGNEDAKYNLELLLAQATKKVAQRQQGQGGEPKKGRSGHRAPGSGY